MACPRQRRKGYAGRDHDGHYPHATATRNRRKHGYGQRSHPNLPCGGNRVAREHGAERFPIDRPKVLEQRFRIERQALEFELRADNARLAAALQSEHGNGPRVSAAVDRSHAVLGKIQKSTLTHILAMRQLLKPNQTAMFDQAVVKALTDGGAR